MFVDAAAAKTLGELSSAGIRGILLKGASFRFMLYGDGTTRRYYDCDILVSSRDIEKAEAVLARLGLKGPPDDLPDARPWHARAWFAPGRPSVDLHRTLVGARVSPLDVWNVLSERTELATVGGLEVEVLDSAARVMHVALNATQHGDRTGKHSSRSLRDLARAVESVPIDVWRDAAGLAFLLDATELFAAGLRLDARGGALADQLEIPRARSVDVILRAGASPPEALALDWLIHVPGWRPKVRLVLRKLFPPKELMFAWLPMAKLGRFGLVCAYALRPFSLLARLPKAIAALQAARRDARRANQ